MRPVALDDGGPAEGAAFAAVNHRQVAGELVLVEVVGVAQMGIRADGGDQAPQLALPELDAHVEERGGGPWPPCRAPPFGDLGELVAPGASLGDEAEQAEHGEAAELGVVAPVRARSRHLPDHVLQGGTVATQGAQQGVEGGMVAQRLAEGDGTDVLRPLAARRPPAQASALRRARG